MGTVHEQGYEIEASTSRHLPCRQPMRRVVSPLPADPRSRVRWVVTIHDANIHYPVGVRCPRCNEPLAEKDVLKDQETLF